MRNANTFICRMSGVSGSATRSSSVVMRPSLVPVPVAVTSTVPCPAATSVPENADAQSSDGVAEGSRPAVLLTGQTSP